jgi:feruloyl esterase
MITSSTAAGSIPLRAAAAESTAPGGPRSRPLCPYPQVAHYSGRGSTDDAASFQCVAPRR